MRGHVCQSAQACETIAVCACMCVCVCVCLCVYVQVVLLCDQGSRSLAEAKAQGYVMDTGLGGALAGGEIPHLQVSV